MPNIDRAARAGRSLVSGAAFTSTLREGLAVAVVAAVAVRVAALSRRAPWSEQASRLRRVRPLPRALRNPARMANAVDRLLRLLPPWRMGGCLKRSLILLDLWSRCELEPRLHLGVRRAADGGIEGHAWITSASGASRGEPRSAEGYVEAWVA